jgi:hypothetical protein
MQVRLQEHRVVRAAAQERRARSERRGPERQDAALQQLVEVRLDREPENGVTIGQSFTVANTAPIGAGSLAERPWSLNRTTVAQNDGCGSDVSALSIVVPAYNEARRLPGTLTRAIEYASRLGEPAEIIVVDDGSTDGTGDVAAAAAPPGDPAVVLRLSPNRGKGAAVRQGMLAARFGHVLLTDVDLPTPIEETAKLRAALAREDLPPLHRA